jgi:short subunit dehydrogenase-like uncharacterized protein
MNNILLYGATGYTGKLCAKIMSENGMQPTLAARNSAVKDTANEFGCDFTIFDLEDQAKIRENLNDIDVVINLAGPFWYTQKALIEACIATKTHYLDIAGEVDEVRSAFDYQDEAEKVGIMVMPAAGFGVVPTDLAAVMAQSLLPDAKELIVAYATEGGASRGTLKTVLKNIDSSGFKRVEGTLIAAKPAESSLDFVVAEQSFSAVYNPWRADLFTAGESTNIPNIETYSVFPGFVVQMMKGKFLWLRDLILNRLINLLPEGPTEKELKQGATYVRAIVRNEAGEQRSVSVKGPEAYLFTVYTLIEITKRILSGEFEKGVKTPSYYGKELLTAITGVTIDQDMG